MSEDRLRLGAVGEDVAAAFLVARGLVIAARNWRCAAGELDIVARDGPTVVFCEVRTRRSWTAGSALESVTPAKQRRLVRLAAIYLIRHGLDGRAVRFDVAAVEVAGWTVALTHVRDAFEAA
jgi:putative endonuclease